MVVDLIPLTEVQVPGVPPWGVKRLLLRVDAQMRAGGSAGFMRRMTPRGRWWVSVAALAAVYPVRDTARVDRDEIRQELETLRATVLDTREKLITLGRAMRRLQTTPGESHVTARTIDLHNCDY